MKFSSAWIALAVLCAWVPQSLSEPCRVVVHVGIPCDEDDRPSYDEIDHEPFDALLKRYVDCQGQVAYGAWKADCQAHSQLYQYLCSLSCVDMTKYASEHGEMAFYINAYNALAIWGILEEYPVPSIQMIKKRRPGYEIFDDLELMIDNEYFSLNSIENDMLRPFEDFRIHFALVCAAQSCPKLRAEAYLGERLDEQLNSNAVEFFTHRDHIAVSRVFHAVKLSPILMWYREDFGECDPEILAAIAGFLMPCDRTWVLSHLCEAKIKYLGYDWSLNDRCPSCKTKLGFTRFKLYAKIEPTVRPIVAKWRESSDESACDEEGLDEYEDEEWEEEPAEE